MNMTNGSATVKKTSAKHRGINPGIIFAEIDGNDVALIVKAVEIGKHRYKCERVPKTSEPHYVSFKDAYSYPRGRATQ